MFVVPSVINLVELTEVYFWWEDAGDLGQLWKLEKGLQLYILPAVNQDSLGFRYPSIYLMRVFQTLL